MQTNLHNLNDNLDDEERDILESYERGEWTEKGKTTLADLQKAASLRPFLSKDFYVVLPDEDVHRLQNRAKKQGISLQELVAAIIHSSLEHEEISQ